MSALTIRPPGPDPVRPARSTPFCSARRRASGRLGALAFAGDEGDDRADLHLVGAFGNEDLRDRAFVDRLELHGRLVGLDLGEQISGGDGVAFLDQPFGERALLHRRRQSGHLEFDGHGGS